MRVKRIRAAWISGLVALPVWAHAAPVDTAVGPPIQRLQAQQLEAAKSLNPKPDELKFDAGEPRRADVRNLPVDHPCFVVERIVLNDNAFDWLAPRLQPVIGQCVGKGALKQLHDVANHALIARGYVTSRVLVPPQSIEGGTLRLQVVPGRVSDVRRSAPDMGWWRAALPISPGALLNQRDIDQGVENLRRLRSLGEATIDIQPGQQPGDSELVVHPNATKRWHMFLGADNAGMDGTGKNQLFGSLTVDSPLHLYDQLQITGYTNADIHSREAGSRSVAVNYNVPLGYALLSMSASRSRYRQTVAGFDTPLVYAGVQSQIQAGLSGVVYRDAHARTELRANVFHQLSRNSIDGVDVTMQRKDAIGYELGATHRQHVGNLVLEGSLGWRASLPGLSNNRGTILDMPEFDGKTQIELAEFGVQVPFKMGAQPFSYQFRWHAQNARTPLTPSDYFTIGTRYTVRGFDQQLTLAAESGWVVSNEVDWYLATPLGMQALYAGIDAGRVRGPAAAYLPGRQLVGAVIGVRGSLAHKRSPATLNYDVSLGWPLAKPANFSTRAPTVLFHVSSGF